MEVFCERNELNMSSLRFLYDGNRIKEEDTPESVSLLTCFHFLIFIIMNVTYTNN